MYSWDISLCFLFSSCSLLCRTIDLYLSLYPNHVLLVYFLLDLPLSLFPNYTLLVRCWTDLFLPLSPSPCVFIIPADYLASCLYPSISLSIYSRSPPPAPLFSSLPSRRSWQRSNFIIFTLMYCFWRGLSRSFLFPLLLSDCPVDLGREINNHWVFIEGVLHLIQMAPPALLFGPLMSPSTERLNYDNW